MNGIQPWIRVVASALLAVVLLGSLLVSPAHALSGMLRAYIEGYLLPRAFPDSSIADSGRVRGYERLLQLRATLGVAHLVPGWSDTASVGVPSVTPCAWRSIGPTNVNGRVTSIAIDPSDHMRVYAATVGGLWRSKDGGRRWRRVSDNIGLSPVLPPARWASVAVNPASASEVFAGSGDPNYALSPLTSARDSSQGMGIWRSTSFGDPGTWFKCTPLALDRQVIFRLRIDPQPPHTVYAATSVGIWTGTRTTTGMTWSRLEDGDPLKDFDFGCSDVVVDFNVTPRLVYAGVYRGKTGIGKGIWKHNGTDWGHRIDGIPSTGIGAVALAMSAQNRGTIFARIADANTGYFHGLYKTISGAEVFGAADAWETLVGAPPNDTFFTLMNDSDFGDGTGYSWYNSVVEVDPLDERIVLAGGMRLLLSSDDGKTWGERVASPDGNFGAIHEDQHAVAFDPVSGHIALVGNDGGIDRSTDLALEFNTAASAPKWHWEHISHGMTTAEFYALAGREDALTALAAGSQDNGTSITFGNRTWYRIQDCDAVSVAMDAENALTLYETCNGRFISRTNPVSGTVGSGAVLTPSTCPSLSANVKLGPPFAADPVNAHHALAAGHNAISHRQRLCRTVDGKCWTEIAGPLATGEVLSCIAIAPSSGFTKFYAGIRGVTASGSLTSKIGVYTGVYPTGAWATTTSNISTSLAVNAIAVDPMVQDRAFAAFGGNAGGEIARTENGGQTWDVLTNVGYSPPPPVLGLVVDPLNTNVIFAGTSITMLMGTVSGTSITWVPFDDGLPVPVDVTGVWLNPVTRILRISTMGFGAFEREIRSIPGQCPAAMLVMRDNVYDRGTEPSPSGEPDPENPKLGMGGWYEADASVAGRVYWWSSSDIRIEVPDPTLPGNQVPPPGIVALLAPNVPMVDHVELESCPLHHATCEPGTMIDSNPVRGKIVKVRIQVANHGLDPASNVRVMALWADAGPSLGQLPADFWTTRFPAGSTTCPAYAPTSGWQAVNPTAPCQVITVLNPDLPQVVTFDWSVPANASDHVCMIAIVESDADPIPARSQNELRPWVLVPNSRHVAQRNLHLIDAPLAPHASPWNTAWLKLGNPTAGPTGIDLVLSRAGLPAGIELELELPTPPVPKATGIRPVTRKTARGRSSSYLVTGTEAVFPALPIAPGAEWAIALRYRTRPGAKPTGPGRFNVLARQDSTILGGNTFILRPPHRRVPQGGHRAQQKK